MKISSILRFIFVFFTLFIINLIKAVDEDNLPNILILIADDLGYGDIGPFGNKTIPTPNFDQLAKAGVKFTHHLAAASLCTPSRAALLTGRLPIRYGLASPWLTRVLIFLASSGGLAQKETTFAKVLKRNNYSTALIGKWHLGNFCSSKRDPCHNPTKFGFDYFYGTPFTNLKDFGNDGSSVITSFFPLFKCSIYICIFVLSSFMIYSMLADFSYFCKRSSKMVKLAGIIVPLIGIILAFSLLMFQKSITRFNSILMRNEEVIEQPILMETLTNRIINESITFIDKNQQENRNFLLMTSFLKVHTAHFPNAEFKGKSKHGKYGDSVMELDWAVGQIINHLERLKIRDNTFIYFSSDNGGHLEEYSINGEFEGGYNGQFKGGKGQGAMEGGIRTPTIVSWLNNGRNKQNEESNVPTSQMDLFPTLAEIVDDKKNLNNLDGESFLDLIKKVKRVSKTRFFFHYCGSYLHGARLVQDMDHIYKIYYYKPKFRSESDYRCEFMCRCTEKYVNKLDPPEIYNLATDPYESKQLNQTLQPGLFKELIDKFADAIDKHKKTIEDVDCELSFPKIIWNPTLQPCCSFPTCTCKENA